MVVITKPLFSYAIIWFIEDLVFVCHHLFCDSGHDCFAHEYWFPFELNFRLSLYFCSNYFVLIRISEGRKGIKLLFSDDLKSMDLCSFERAFVGSNDPLAGNLLVY